MFILGENQRSLMESIVGFPIELHKWYYGIDLLDFTDFKEYTGTCPITLADFENGNINCRTYLERLINSFNK